MIGVPRHRALKIAIESNNVMQETFIKPQLFSIKKF